MVPTNPNNAHSYFIRISFLNEKPHLSLCVIRNPALDTKGIPRSCLGIKAKCISYSCRFTLSPYIRKSTSCIYSTLTHRKS